MLALLCGGQGRLGPGIFDLAAGSPAAAPIFAAAAGLLGQDPRGLVRAEAADQLTDNRLSQILTVTASLALHAALADALPECCAVLGYSVGEMAAWSIAGVWDAERALRLTAARAEAMTAAASVPGRLAYVRGLPEGRLAAMAAARGCAIAIRNPGRLFVVGGPEEAIAALCAEAEAGGAERAAPLAVRIAAHTCLLDAAIEPFTAALAASRPRDPDAGRWLLAGSGGARIFRVEAALPRLASQVARPIDWAETMQALGELGCDRILDLGPGAALAQMAGGAQSYAAAQFSTLDGLRRWCAA
ncbi:acyltransferase domain-containing protein [Acidisoma sp. C75]